MLGLYRGFGMSIATFVPTSGIWWGAYGAYQKLIWQQVLICSHGPCLEILQGLHVEACCLIQKVLGAALTEPQQQSLQQQSLLRSSHLSQVLSTLQTVLPRSIALVLFCMGSKEAAAAPISSVVASKGVWGLGRR